MSDDTIDISCPVGEWTSITIASGAVSVVIGAQGGSLLVRKADAEPSAGVSYGYSVLSGSEKTFSIEDGDALWARPGPDTSVGPVTAIVWS
jgi:hypothetical protein